MAKDRRTKAELAKEIKRLQKEAKGDEHFAREKVDECEGLKDYCEEQVAEVSALKEAGAQKDAEIARLKKAKETLACHLDTATTSCVEKSQRIDGLKNDVAEAVRERDGLRESSRERYLELEACRLRANQLTYAKETLERECGALRERLDEQTRRATTFEDNLQGALMAAYATGRGNAGRRPPK